MTEEKKAEAADSHSFPRRFSIWFTIFFAAIYWPRLFLLPIRGPFIHLEGVLYDKLYAISEGFLPHGDKRIIIAAADEETGKRFEFPLPRSVYAKMLDKLKLLGVKTVVFDVLFLDPREHDRELIAATKRFGKAIHLFHTELRTTPVGDAYTTVTPIPGLEKASEHLGYPNVDRVLDDDGHIRRALLFDTRAQNPLDRDQVGPSLDAVGFASYTGKTLKELEAKYGADQIHWVNFRAPMKWMKHPSRDKRAEGKKVNIADLAQVESPYRRVSILDIIEGTLTDEQKQALKGAIVLVGSTSLGYFDHYPTPFLAEGAPGVEYHCNLLDNMLNDDFLQPVARFWILLVILAMIWVPLYLQRLQPSQATAIAGGMALLWTGGAYWGFLKGLRLEFAAPLSALLVSFLVQTVHRVRAEGAEKARIKGLFGQFVAPEVVEDLAQNPDKARLGGEKREMTMFFLDIAHFTTISEKMPADKLLMFLNSYLNALSEVVLARKAVVGNYIGDCIMAFWNAPILPANDDHRQLACLAALECKAKIEELNKTPIEGLPETPAVRIGLNSGAVTVGMTGSQKRLQYTVLGDEVNLCSRLEGANKFFGSTIMASEATFEGAKDAVEARELGRVRVVGKETPIRVFELIAKKGELSDKWKEALAHYAKGLAHFNKREYADAALSFQELIKIFPDDGPGTLYLNASRDYAAIPPEDSWDGVFNLTAK